MTIPFLDMFKKAKARLMELATPAPSARGPAVAAEKPDSERLSKTVLPNMTRTSSLDPFREAADSSPNIRLPGSRSAGRDLPPTVALALQPKVERAISLQLCDILDGMPNGFVKPIETFDSAQRILLKASEIEKGMATGKPSVSLATVYEQVPEIFLHTVAPTDSTFIGLPYDKVLDQFQKVQVRPDQERDQDVPQVETPFLQVTLEDTERFGTTMPTLQTSEHPPVLVEPATAKALSKAEPEPAAQETSGRAAKPAKGTAIPAPPAPTVPPPRPSGPESVVPTRIPFHLPPNGTGVPASEGVPASSGPSVPISMPKAATPGRVPFKISAPCEDLKPKLRLVPGFESQEGAAPSSATTPTKKDDVKIALGLRTVMQNMPAFQLNGSAETVPAEARIEFLASLIEPQLAKGRIAVPAKTFQAALPEAHRALFVIDAVESPVLLPLQEVLNNLPAAALKMREDQEKTDEMAAFETPFSIKAAEDAKRFAASTPPEAKKPEEPAADTPATTEEPKEESKVFKYVAGSGKPAKLKEKARKKEAPAGSAEKIEAKTEKKPEPKKDEKAEAKAENKLEAKKDGKSEARNEAKNVVERASALPGVKACAVTFADGLSLAGNLPPEVAADGLCAMAPSLLQRIDRHMLDTKLGPMTSMTLHCEKSPITFFMKGNVCLAVLHAGGDLASGTQSELAGMATELSRIYSQPETTHVDH